VQTGSLCAVEATRRVHHAQSLMMGRIIYGAMPALREFEGKVITICFVNQSHPNRLAAPCTDVFYPYAAIHAMVISTPALSLSETAFGV
jgi:hypothetical protein